ncbi:hypothetical protein KA043_01105 [Candidatus Saccharibacteria bacterium]|nr:hypothetical protein [Candidatus Saccharibacteria bacterium]
MSKWGPSTICSVYIKNDAEPIEVRINTAQLKRAELEKVRMKGRHETDQASICIKVREACKKQHGYDPGWLNYENLELLQLRDVPAGA